MDYKRLFAKAVRDWPAKVLCLGLAIILFVFNRMSNLDSRFLSAPLRIEKLSSLMPSKSYPKMIRVTLRGEANSIFPIQESDVEVFVEMEQIVEPGTYTVPVQWRKKGTALGVEPLQITVDPAEINFTLDYKISKFVPLLPNFQGQVDSGFSMASYTLYPNQIIIDGPANLMVNIAELLTEPIDLDGRRSDFSGTVNIMQSEPLVLIRGSGTSEFYGTISQIIPVRNISNVPIVITGIKDGLTGELERKTGSIHLEAENQEAVQRFVPPPDFLRVDCSGISEPGNYILRVLADSTGGISVMVDPEEVTIKISPARNKP